jgi:hypothetical protein
VLVAFAFSMLEPLYRMPDRVGTEVQPPPGYAPLAPLVLLILIACLWLVIDTGSDGTASGDTGSGDTDSGDTGPGDCTCVPSIPAGWHGPVAAIEANGSLPGCPSSYPRASLGLYAGLEAPEAQCDCSCGPIDGDCLGSTVSYYSGPSCDNGAGPSPDSVDVGECFPVNPVIAEEGHHAGFALDDPTDTGCAPSLDRTILPPEVWSLHVSVCDGAQVAQCDRDELCVPSDTPACIVTDGEHPCPISYSTRVVRYKDVTDNRACECACSANGLCSGTIEFFAGGQCSSLLAAVDEESCYQVSDVTGLIVQSAITGSCAATGTALGEAVPAEPVTICCRN